MTLFELGWILFIFKNYLSIANNISLPDWMDDIFALVILVIFASSIYKKKYTTKELVVCVTLAVLALHTGYVTGYMVLTTSVLSIIAVKGENIIAIARKTFYAQLILLIFNTIYSVFLFWIGTGSLWYYSEVDRLRISLGYGMAGHLADCVLNLVFLWILIHYPHITSKNYIFMVILGVILYVITDSRVIFCIFNFFIITVYLTKKKGKRKYERYIRLITRIIVPLCTACMLLFIRLYEIGNPVGRLMDKILNSRVRLCGYNLDLYGATFGGQFCANSYDERNYNLHVKWSSKGGIYDNMYIWFIVNLGLLWLIALSLKMVYIALKGEMIVCIMLITCALGAMIDTDFVNSARCFPVLFLGATYEITGIKENKY